MLSGESDVFLVEILEAKGIPIPNDSLRSGIIDRRVRVCLYSGDTPVSNAHCLRAGWAPTAEDEWRFGDRGGKKGSSRSEGSRFIVTKDKTEARLVLELTIEMEQDAPERMLSPRERSRDSLSHSMEFACGWAELHLGRNESGSDGAKIVTRELDVLGGSPSADAAINLSEVSARRSGIRSLGKLFKGAPRPTVSVRLTPISQMKRKLQEHVSSLPPFAVVEAESVKVIQLFREIMADDNLRPLQPLCRSVRQRVPIRLFLQLANIPEALHTVAEIWNRRKSQWTAKDKRETAQG
eukprot:66693_1